jgi:uracil-DNA glycosylase
MSDLIFAADCKLCPRLANFLEEVRTQYPDYYAKPVPAFGDAKAQLLIVGLAPGYHGANASGRPFTGDFAGILLYETLYACGLSTAPVSTSVNDGLKLVNCRITNAVKCLPPQNKPEPSEITTCNRYLKNELAGLQSGSVILALGTIAHQAVLKALDLKLSQYKFAHAAEHVLPNLTMIDSYHCSRYNTQTKRLTAQMFKAVMLQAKAKLP